MQISYISMSKVYFAKHICYDNRSHCLKVTFITFDVDGFNIGPVSLKNRCKLNQYFHIALFIIGRGGLYLKFDAVVRFLSFGFIESDFIQKKLDMTWFY